MQYFICVNLCKFTVTMCEAESTKSTEFDSTVCYDSNSSNHSVSSGPMFIEDDSDTDDNLPEIQPCSFDSPSALPPPATAAAPGAPASQATPTATAEKCKCHENCQDKAFLSKLTIFFVLCLSPFFISKDWIFSVPFILFIIF